MRVGKRGEESEGSLSFMLWGTYLFRAMARNFSKHMRHVRSNRDGFGLKIGP